MRSTVPAQSTALTSRKSHGRRGGVRPNQPADQNVIALDLVADFDSCTLQAIARFR